MRTALEQRLRDRHSATKLPLDRLRKEVALQRLLARISLPHPLATGRSKAEAAYHQACLTLLIPS